MANRPRRELGVVDHFLWFIVSVIVPVATVILAVAVLYGVAVVLVGAF